MMAKLLLLLALLAPVLTVAAGVLTNRRKRPEREHRKDNSS